MKQLIRSSSSSEPVHKDVKIYPPLFSHLPTKRRGVNCVQPIIRIANSDNPNAHPNNPTFDASTPTLNDASVGFPEASIHGISPTLPLSKDHAKQSTSADPETLLQGLGSHKNGEHLAEPFIQSHQIVDQLTQEVARLTNQNKKYVGLIT